LTRSASSAVDVVGIGRLFTPLLLWPVLAIAAVTNCAALAAIASPQSSPN